MENLLFKDFFIAHCEKRLEKKMCREMSKIASIHYIKINSDAGTWSRFQKRMLNFDKKDKISNLIKQNIIFDKFDYPETSMLTVVNNSRNPAVAYSIKLCYNQVQQKAVFRFNDTLMRKWQFSIK